MSNLFKEYSDTLAQCMVAYQFLEEGLKFCLYRCHAIIKFRVWGMLPYEAPLASIDNAALGRLIEQYKIFTNDDELIKKLREIKNHRDFCAHKGYLLTSDEQKDSAYLSEKKNELEQFLSEANESMNLLKTEMEKMDKLVENVYSKLKTESGKSWYLASSPHTTLHAGPHRAVHLTTRSGIEL